MPVTITKIENLRRISVTGDPSTYTNVPATVVPGDVVYREDGALSFLMTDAGLVAGTSLDQSPAFTSMTVSLTAAITGKLTGTGTVTAATGVADGTALTVTPTAAANNDVLTVLKLSVAAGTPGAFTGLVRQGLSIPAFTVVGDTSPGDPVGISVGVITGTGASVATALKLAPPTGATTLYLMSHTTAATFNVSSVGSLTTAGFLKSTSPTLGIGYATGAGGAQTQGAGSGKATTVVSNTVTTLITMDGAQLGLLAIVSFTFTNSSIAATDHILINHESAGTIGAYTFAATPGGGAATIYVRNATAGNLSEAIVIRVTIIKAVSA